MMEHTLWVESYRPKTIDDCVLTDDIKSVAKGIVSKGELPNLILSGPAGTGKTTLAKALCNELGYDYMIINVSNDRGIDVLRTQITQFASSVSLTSDMKVVILDEGDHATPLFQAALRGFVEEFSKTTRFVITCNYPQKLIPAIHSRFATLDYTIKNKDKAVVGSEIMKRVMHILNEEQVEYEKPAVAELVLKFFPDFRRIINELQRYSSINGKIDKGILGALDSVGIDEYVKAIKEKNFKNAKRWIVENLATSDQQVLYRKIYDSLFDILDPSSIPQVILLIANYQFRGMTSVDPEVQFAAFTIEMMTEAQFQ